MCFQVAVTTGCICNLSYIRQRERQQRQRGRGEGRVRAPPFTGSLPNSQNSQLVARLKPRARNSVLGLHKGAGAQVLRPSSSVPWAC